MRNRLLGIPIVTLVVILFFIVVSPALGQGPDQVVLFSDKFDNGKADNWQLDAGWQVEKDDDNYVLSGEGHNWARQVQRGTWSDYKLSLRVKLLAGGIHLNYRNSDCLRYFIRIQSSGVTLAKTMPCGTQPNLVSIPGNYTLNQWHTVEIVGKGSNIKVLVDGAQLIDFTDPDPLLIGSIAFETLDSSHVHVDDISVTGSPPPKGFTWIRTGGPLGGLGYDIDKKKILLDEPIKRLGNFSVPIKISPEDRAEVKVIVAREEAGGAEAGGDEGKTEDQTTGKT